MEKSAWVRRSMSLWCLNSPVVKPRRRMFLSIDFMGASRPLRMRVSGAGLFGSSLYSGEPDRLVLRMIRTRVCVKAMSLASAVGACATAAFTWRRVSSMSS